MPDNPLIYVSYSYEDSNWFEYIFPYLASAARTADVKIWPPDTNRYYQDEDRETGRAIETLHSCAVFILLVSPHSQASKFINEVEFPIIRRRVIGGEEVEIVPIIVSPAAEIRLDDVSDRNLRSRNEKPLSTLTDAQRDREMTGIVDQIELAILRSRSQASIAPQMHPEPNSPTTLLELRAGAEIERFHIPDIEIRQPDRSSDARYSVVVEEPVHSHSASSASEASPDVSFSRARKSASPAELEALRSIAESLRRSRQESPPALSAMQESYSRPAEQANYSEHRVGSSNYLRHSPPRSSASNRLKWFIVGASAAGLGALLYWRGFSGLIAPLVKLFGSMAPPMASADPPARDSSDADNVELAAFGPRVCAPGDTILVQALLHLPADEPAAHMLAVAADPGAVRKATQTLSIALRNREKLEIDLEADGCRIDEVRQTTIWRGQPVAVQFFATVPRRREKSIPVRITATRSGIPVGSVRFTVPVQIGADSQPVELRGDEAKRFERAFVSYASEDRVSVLPFAHILDLTGIKVFQDILSLEPGERWERRLYAEIDRCDLFLLFWSRAASRSKWVVAEAEYALNSYNASGSQKPVIRPVMLEGPPIPDIPASLESIHFNDKFRYIILGAMAEADAGRSIHPPH